MPMGWRQTLGADQTTTSPGDQHHRHLAPAVTVTTNLPHNHPHQQNTPSSVFLLLPERFSVQMERGKRRADKDASRGGWIRTHQRKLLPLLPECQRPNYASQYTGLVLRPSLLSTSQPEKRQQTCNLWRQARPAQELAVAERETERQRKREREKRETQPVVILIGSWGPPLINRL